MSRWASLLASLLVAGCATLASPAGDDDAVRPNAHAGPFRALAGQETVGAAPNVLVGDAELQFEEPGVLRRTTTPGLGPVALYAVTTVGGVPGIYRFLAEDARGFRARPQPPSPVLTATQAWEGAAVRSPAPLAWSGKVWLYYSTSGGIGVAWSSDGERFEPAPGPALAAAPEGWDAGLVPAAPSVVALPSGELRLFYEAGGAIGEARSSDGLSFERLGDAPVLEPETVEGAPGQLSVHGPDAHLALSAEGRPLTQLYYGSEAADGTSVIGYAARFGEAGSLTRAAAPAFTSSRNPRSPCVVDFGSLRLLYVSQRAGSTNNLRHSVIAAGVAPGDLKLPPAERQP